MQFRLATGSERRRRWLKVPEITVYFWIVKLLTTAMGEAFSDYLVHHINPYVAVAAGAAGFLAAMALQFSARKYQAVVYWLFVVMVAVFGTMVADVVHIVLKVPYLYSSIAFAVLLTVVFSLWYRTERNLSIHSIFTVRREAFYWAAVLATFAMGTATGDMTARTLHLGYLASAVLFTVLFVLPGLFRRFFGMGEVLAFWWAYVMTRPLGASVADWFGMPHAFGGLGYGRGLVAAILTVFIVAFVGYLSITRIDVPRQSGQWQRDPSDAAM